MSDMTCEEHGADSSHDKCAICERQGKPPPKYRFCWWCSRKLRGSFHRVADVAGTDVRLHAACADEMLREGEPITMIRCDEGCKCRKAVGEPQGEGGANE